MPMERATDSAVGAASPVTITVRTPSDRSSASSCRGIRPWRIVESNQSDKHHLTRRAARNRQRPVAGLGQ